MAQLIESQGNSKYKIWKSLLESKGIKKNGLCILSGEKIVAEQLQNLESLLFIEGQSHQLCEDFSSDRLFLLSKPLFSELDSLGTKSPLGIVKVPEFESWEPTENKEGLELLVPLGDPSNLGAVIRSAAAFGVKNIVLLQEAAHPFHPKSIRASAGAVFSAGFSKGPSITALENVERLLTLDESGTDIEEFEWPKNPRLLIGDEGPGIPQNLRHKSSTLKISQEGVVESLNATVAASIALQKYYGAKKS